MSHDANTIDSRTHEGELNKLGFWIFLTAELNKKNLDGMYVTNLTNVRYLTGFTGSAGSMLIIDNKKHFFTDGRYITQSKEQVKNCQTHIVGGGYFQFIAENN